MASWGEFAAQDSALASAIRTLICQYGPGLAYLATIRPDGGPRIHPVSPVITTTGLYCFVLPSPKRHDLDRDGRYSLHSYPPEESDDEAYLTGQATPITDPSADPSVEPSADPTPVEPAATTKPAAATTPKPATATPSTQQKPATTTPRPATTSTPASAASAPSAAEVQATAPPADATPPQLPPDQPLPPPEPQPE